MTRKEPIENGCLLCGDKTFAIRHTQFAGSHPYCEKCAKKESDFMCETDSYKDWEIL